LNSFLNKTDEKTQLEKVMRRRCLSLAPPALTYPETQAQEEDFAPSTIVAPDSGCNITCHMIYSNGFQFQHNN
jgi:hypothetical protein